jgi:hypothetical protein
MAATVIPLAWPIAIEVLVSLIDIDVLVWVIDVLAWLAALGVLELLELLEPQPAAANAAANGTIRWRLAIMHPSSVGAGAARSGARDLPNTFWRGLDPRTSRTVQKCRATVNLPVS